MSILKSLLGKTKLNVTKLSLGAALRSGDTKRPIELSEPEANNLFNTLLDNGINFIDTSPDYANSETLIGKSISHRRNEFYIATKCGCPITQDQSKHVWNSKQIEKNITESLSKLKTDYIDLLQLHNPPIRECIDGYLLETLLKLKEKGLTRFIGISTTLPDIKSYINWNDFDTFQIPYSTLDRKHEDWISSCNRRGFGTIIRGGVALGESEKKLLNSNILIKSIEEKSTINSWEIYEEANLDELRDPEDTPSGFLLRFAISNPNIHTVIVGTTNIKHLKENIKAAEKGPLQPDVYQKIIDMTKTLIKNK